MLKEGQDEIGERWRLLHLVTVPCGQGFETSSSMRDDLEEGVAGGNALAQAE